MNSGNKIFGKHIRQLLHKNVYQRFDVLVVQNGIVVLQNNCKERQKSVLHLNFFFFFLLIRKKKSVLHVQIYFLLIRAIDLDASLIAEALAKSIYYVCAEGAPHNTSCLLSSFGSNCVCDYVRL